MKSVPEIFITFDGGCKPNPGSMYGSLLITHDHGFTGGPRPILRLDKVALGEGTSNQAEYRTMILAIRRTLELLDVAGMEPKKFCITITTDSEIVAARVNGEPVVNGNRILRELGAVAQELLEKFKIYSAKWMDRSNMVELFGH